MRRSHPLFSTVLGCCAVACLAVDAATAPTGCSSEGRALPKHVVSKTPPPVGRGAQATTRPSRPGDLGPVPPGSAAAASTQPSKPTTSRPTTGASKAPITSRHVPYIESKCQTCHGSDTGGAVSSDFKAACQECHGALFAYRRFGHSPTVVGACGVCHVMHESEHAALLKSSQRDLCAGCHPAGQTERARSSYHRGIETVACTACHDPHFADNYLLLKPEEVRRRLPLPVEQDAEGRGGRPGSGGSSVSGMPASFLGMIIGVSARPALHAHAWMANPGLPPSFFYTSRLGGGPMGRTMLGDAARRPWSAALMRFFSISARVDSTCVEQRGLPPRAISHSSSAIRNPQSPIPNPQSPKGCLAAGCHADLAEPKYLHGPMAVDGCGRCHEETDAEDHKYRVSAEGPELCFACHAKLQAGLRDTFTRPHHHPPVDDGLCLECHDPHASGLPMLLRGDSVVEACLECHEDDIPLDDPVHTVIEEEKGCIACHRGHNSAHAALLRRPGGELCLGCHEDTAAALASLRHVHPPAGDRECGACHTPHASAHGNLLVEPFAAGMYAPYDDGESYALCFECHDIEMLEEKETDEDTDFRNGERNLHHLHVNKALKGRSCRTCHLPHAAGQHRLIRGELAFGAWTLGLRYLPTDTGGYCGPACHPAKRYDRATPVDWDQEPVAPAKTED